MDLRFSLTKNEYDLMRILWESGKPMVKREIMEKCDPDRWSDTYLKKTLTCLLQKDALTTVGKTRVGGFTSRLYTPTLSQDEYHLSRYPISSPKSLVGLVGNYYNDSDEENRSELVTELEALLQSIKEND